MARSRNQIKMADFDRLFFEYKSGNINKIDICGEIYGGYIINELQLRTIRGLIGIFAGHKLQNQEIIEFWSDYLYKKILFLSNIRIRHNNTRKKRRYYIDTNYNKDNKIDNESILSIIEVVKTQPEHPTPLRYEDHSDCFDFIYNQVPIILDLIIDNNKDKIKEYVDSL